MTTQRNHMIYRTGLELLGDNFEFALMSDGYAWTMSQGWHNAKMLQQQAAFYAFFRRLPSHAGYAIFGGSDYLAELIKRFRFTTEVLEWMSTLSAPNGGRAFTSAFLGAIEGEALSINLDTVREGSVVFPQEPITRGVGPLWQLELIEGGLLNFLNSQTSVMSRAARMCEATGWPENLRIADNSLRRGNGIGCLDNALAAYKGGFSATSNMAAAYYFGIPWSGTMAHCWVTSFFTQKEAFLAFARANRNNVVFLVDTYNTLFGIRESIECAKILQEEGIKLHGIRLDSGDLAKLSIEARKLLDEAGLQDVAVIATNSLNEKTIRSLNQQGAQIAVYASGDSIAEPGLNGIVWKLSALQDSGAPGGWRKMFKLSEIPEKMSIPGHNVLRRYRNSAGEIVCDLIVNEEQAKSFGGSATDPGNSNRFLTVSHNWQAEDMLQPLVQNGVVNKANVYWPSKVRQYVREQVLSLPAGFRRQDNPEAAPVYLADEIFFERQRRQRQLMAQGSQL